MSTATPCVNCTELSEFIVAYGDYICSKCGAVQPEQVIDTGQEWRDFEDDIGHVEKARAELANEDDFHSLDTGVSKLYD